MKTLAAMLMVVGLLGCGAQQASNTSSTETPPAGDVAADAQQAVTTDEHGTRVVLAVTEDGFVPARVTVPAGKPVTLVVTRKTDKTCATALVLPDYHINQQLPMDQAVEIAFTPEKPGELTYACPMDMIKGVIAVQ